MKRIALAATLILLGFACEPEPTDLTPSPVGPSTVQGREPSHAVPCLGDDCIGPPSDGVQPDPNKCVGPVPMSGGRELWHCPRGAGEDLYGMICIEYGSVRVCSWLET